jgi:hypothetical protein
VYEDKKSSGGPHYHEALRAAKNFKFQSISAEGKVLAGKGA